MTGAVELAGLLESLAALVRQAGELILQVYRTPFEVQHKADASPVTLADQLAEDCITQALLRLEPGTAVVAEEAASRALAVGPAGLAGDDQTEEPAAPRYWLVDPLDGTREFVSRNGQFSVNIALMVQQRPVLGIVYAPVTGLLLAGVVGQGAWVEQDGRRSALHTRCMPEAGAVLASSLSHGNEAALNQWLGLQRFKVQQTLRSGSSLKFGLLAQGLADVYPRFGPTMEWDTAAGDAVLRAAGGCVLGPDGQDLRYGKAGWRNPHFVAWGRRPVDGAEERSSGSFG